MAEDKTGEGWNQPEEGEDKAVGPLAQPTPGFLKQYQKPHVEFTDERKQKFLIELARTGLRSHSADVAGVTIVTIRRHEAKDEAFAELAIEAKEYFVDGLEAEAIRRATEGILEPVFSQKTGTQIGVIRKYSDRLLEVLLRAGRPDKFRDQVSHEHKHSGGVLVVPGAALNDQAWEDSFALDANGAKAIPAQIAVKKTES